MFISALTQDKESKKTQEANRKMYQKCVEIWREAPSSARLVDAISFS